MLVAYHNATRVYTRCATRCAALVPLTFFGMQISRAILNEQQKFRMPKWFEEDKPPVTKAELEEKINQLHSAINDVAASIGPESNDRSRVTTTGHSSKSNGSGNSSKVLDAISQ